MEVCRFFQQGRCAFGTACRLLHELPTGAPVRRPPPPQASPPPPPLPQPEVWRGYGGYEEQAWQEEQPEVDTRELDMKEKRKIDKAMREIEGLEERLDKGDRLQNNQLKKMEKKAEYVKRLAELEESLSTLPPERPAAPSRPMIPPGPWDSQGYPCDPRSPPASSSRSAGPPPPFGDARFLQFPDPEGGFQRGSGGEMLEPSFDPEDPECGICFESIRKKGERFGILESCDHAFCLTCIREWRKQREQQDRQNLRLCPVCRNESFFVVPCDDIFLDPVEKNRAIQTYKKEMARIPCKLFDYGKGKCTFGNSCFYAHLNPDGTRFVPAPLRWRCGADGNSVIGEVKLSDHLARSLALP